MEIAGIYEGAELKGDLWQVKKLPLNSVKAQLLSEERYLGTVTRELNSGQWRSEVRFYSLRGGNRGLQSLPC